MKADVAIPRDVVPNVAAKLKAKQPIKIAVFAGDNHAQGGWRQDVAK